MHLNLCHETNKISKKLRCVDDVSRSDESVMKECTVSPSEVPTK